MFVFSGFLILHFKSGSIPIDKSLQNRIEFREFFLRNECAYFCVFLHLTIRHAQLGILGMRLVLLQNKHLITLSISRPRCHLDLLSPPVFGLETLNSE